MIVIYMMVVINMIVVYMILIFKVKQNMSDNKITRLLFEDGLMYSAIPMTKTDSTQDGLNFETRHGGIILIRKLYYKMVKIIIIIPKKVFTIIDGPRVHNNIMIFYDEKTDVKSLGMLANLLIHQKGCKCVYWEYYLEFSAKLCYDGILINGTYQYSTANAIVYIELNLSHIYIQSKCKGLALYSKKFISFSYSNNLIYFEYLDQKNQKAIVTMLTSKNICIKLCLLFI